MLVNDDSLGARIDACLSGIGDPARFPGELMAHLTAEFEVDRGSFFLIDPQTMTLRSEIAGGMGKTLVVPLRIGVIGAAILHRRALRVDDAYSHPYFDPGIDSALGFHTRSLLVAPMIASTGRVLGGVEMINKNQGGFTTDDEVKALAAAARIARWIEEETIYPAGVEAEAVAMRRALQCERVSVFTFDHRSNRLVSLFADGNEGRLLSLNVKLGVAGMVAITGKGILLTDAWADERFDRTVDASTGYRTQTMICSAITTNEGPALGVIQLINRAGGPFDAGHLALLDAISRRVATALGSMSSPT